MNIDGVDVIFVTLVLVAAVGFTAFVVGLRAWRKHKRAEALRLLGGGR